MKQEIELSKVETIVRIEELKAGIDKLRPLSNEIEDKIFQKFRLDWNYHSNAIEGNTLNYGETYAFLMHGVTAKGKPLKDYLDIKGHNNAINFLLNFIHDKEELTEAAIRELHKTILSEPYEIDAVTSNGKTTKKKVELGAYKKSPNHVLTSTGEMHYFATPEETPAKMHDLLIWFREAQKNKDIHPVVIASAFHHKFAAIHPFDDGNGRIARLLMNLILMQYHLPPAIIKKEDRGNYYLALSQADVGIYAPFVEYISERVIHSLEIYLKGARGESIEEADDIDKEILLFKKERELAEDRVEKTNTLDTKIEVVRYFETLINQLDICISKFREFFFEYSKSYTLYNPDRTGFGSSELNKFQLEEIIHVLTNNRGIIGVEFSFILNKYKSLKNPFSFVVTFNIFFEEFDFKIYCSLNQTPQERKPNSLIEHVSELLSEQSFSYDDYTFSTQIDTIPQIVSKRILNIIKSYNLK